MCVGYQTSARVVRTRSSALTQAGVFQHDGSVMETMIAETCLMNRTAVSVYIIHDTHIDPIRVAVCDHCTFLFTTQYNFEYSKCL